MTQNSRSQAQRRQSVLQSAVFLVIILGTKHQHAMLPMPDLCQLQGLSASFVKGSHLAAPVKACCPSRPDEFVLSWAALLILLNPSFVLFLKSQG